MQEWTLREDSAGVDIAGSRRDAISQRNHFTATPNYTDYSNAHERRTAFGVDN